MDLELPKQIVQGFTGALKGLRLYPAGHPAIRRQFETLRANLGASFNGREAVRLGLLQGTLFFDDYLFAEDSPAARELGAQLQGLDLEGLELFPRLTLEELSGLVSLMAAGASKGPAFEEQLVRQGLKNVRAMVAQAKEDNEGLPAPRKVYGRALKAVDNIFQDVRLGRIPTCEEARQVVATMAHMTITDPHALFALSLLKDYDNYTFTHSVNVAVIALAVGRACGLSEERLRVLGLGGLLHDLGKLKIGLDIINKPGRLTEEEFEEIRKHPQTGADLVAQMDGITPEIIDIVLGHHLRHNRQGYPAEARAREVSPLTEMTAIADSYDAMTTLRSYPQPVTPRKAIKLLQDVAGTALNPHFVEKFITSLGPYPVGSLVRLDSNEIGVVVWVSPSDPNDVQVKMLFDRTGKSLPLPQVTALSGPGSRRIVAEVDPFVRGIDVADFIV
jgi:putative nucleotidyltransferase with HDIG domain